MENELVAYNYGNMSAVEQNSILTFPDLNPSRFLADIQEPLKYVDPYADLDLILASKSIGEAIQLLCPILPGIPTKPRGKYKKRKLLDPMEKEQVLKDQNRDNANRTRQRKKIYEEFLDNLIHNLEEKLYPESVNTTKIQRNLLMSNILVCNQMNFPKENMLQKSTTYNQDIMIKNKTQQLLKASLDFLKMRCSRTAKLQPWHEIVASEIIYCMPNPIYRTTSSLGVLRGNYECYGIEALVDDTTHRVNHMSQLLLGRCWAVKIEVYEDKISYQSYENSISFPYDLIVYDPKALSARFTDGVEYPEEVRFLTVSIEYRAVFHQSGKISSIQEMFDVKDVMKRTKLIFQRFGPPMLHIDTNEHTPSIIGSRLFMSRKFLNMRLSFRPGEELWHSVCTSDIEHIMPQPEYRPISPLGTIRDTSLFECRGAMALVDDTVIRMKFISMLVHCAASGPATWHIDIKVQTTGAKLSHSGNRLQFAYLMVLYAVPLLHGSVLSDSSMWIELLSLPICCDVEFSEDGLVSSFHEQFDSNYVKILCSKYFASNDEVFKSRVYRNNPNRRIGISSSDYPGSDNADEFSSQRFSLNTECVFQPIFHCEQPRGADLRHRSSSRTADQFGATPGPSSPKRFPGEGHGDPSTTRGLWEPKPANRPLCLYATGDYLDPRSDDNSTSNYTHSDQDLTLEESSPYSHDSHQISLECEDCNPYEPL